MKKERTYELSKRLLCTILILAVYMAGRSLLLYNVDAAAHQLEELDSQNIVLSMVSGERYQYTVFALGIMPYITSTLIMWVITALMSSDFKARFSPKKRERLTWVIMLAISLSLAMSRAEELIFKESNLNYETLKIIAISEMIMGAIIIFQLANVNKEHGIAGQMPIILVNIIDGLVSTIQKSTWEELQKPLILCVIMAVMMFVMETKLIRIPVQRVSIHSEYADKSSIIFKVDPIGVMPIMFAVAIFRIPQMIVHLLMSLYEENHTLLVIYEKLNLTNATGVAVYLGIIFGLNLLFSFIMLTPGEMAKQLQRGGDSIVDVYAGKKTKRYLRRKLLLLCVISGSLFCLLMGISLGLALKGEISSELALFPATASILTGLGLPLYREIKAYWRFDTYSFFI